MAYPVVHMHVYVHVRVCIYIYPSLCVLAPTNMDSVRNIHTRQVLDITEHGALDQVSKNTFVLSMRVHA